MKNISRSVLAVLSLLCWSALAVDQSILLNQFKEFKAKFSKVYHSQEEELKRFNIFTENVLKAELHNRQDNLFTRGVNMFSDLTQERWEATGYLPHWVQEDDSRYLSKTLSSSAPAPAPLKFLVPLQIKSNQ